MKEEIQSLQKLREQYENQLRMVGIELCDLPDDIHALLDECVRLQTVTNLHSLDECYLKDFYYAKRKEHIDNKLIIAKLRADIKAQEEQIQQTSAECTELEKFTNEMTKRLVSEAEKERNTHVLEKKMKELNDKLNALNVPENLNIDELFNKIDTLKQQKTNNK